MRETVKDYCLEHGREELLTQWHFSKNGDLTPDRVTYGSQKRIWWHCEKGHEWKAVIYSRTGAQKCGCPECAGKAPRIYD